MSYIPYCQYFVDKYEGYYPSQTNEALLSKFSRLKTKKAKRKVIQQIIQGNIPLIVSRVFRFLDIYDMDKSQENIEDLFIEGTMGFIKGMERYNIDKKSCPSTYLVWWIDSRIRRGIKNLTNIISYPDWSYYKNTKRGLMDNTKLALSLRSSIPEKYRYVPIISQMEYVDGDGSSSFITEDNLDGQKSEEIPYLLCMSKQIFELIKEICTKRERWILYHRFSEMKTLDEIAEDLNLSKERIRQIENEVLMRIMRNGFKKEEVVSSIVFMSINAKDFKKLFLK